MDDTALLQALREKTYNLMALFRMSHEERSNGLNWFRAVGFIGPTYECPDCGRDMELMKVKNDINGYEWQCSTNQHKTTRSVILGSCFAHFPLDIQDTLLVMYSWFRKTMLDIVKEELCFNDDKEMLITDVFTLCREICVIDLINNSDKIGGEGVNIEMDICKLGEMKYMKDKLPNGEWVFGGYESKTKCFFIRIIGNNTKPELLKVISNWVLPGSVILSNCSELYSYLSGEDFECLCQTNNLTFQQSARQKAIEVAQSSFEGPLKNNVNVVFDSLLGEHIWRKKHESKNLRQFEVFPIFLKSVIKNHQPLCRDNQV